MTNLGMEHALARLGLPFGRAKVGDRYVLELLQEKGWQLGGETSGHILCLDKHKTGDGIISALQVLHALKDSGASLAEYTRDLTLYPQVLINVPIAKRIDLAAALPVKQAEEKARADMGNDGRIVLRPSGTEPLIRVMVESASEPQARKWAEHIAESVKIAAAA
jgi:phosphoglucosamine mutase